MKKLFFIFLFVGISSALFLVGCEKKTETLNGAAVNDYYPFKVGRTYLYRMDSTVPARFGTALVIKSYQAKDSIEAMFNDNQGRASYRIFRYTRDTAGTQAWKFAATYVATPTRESVEYVDNNMRFIKLRLPIRDGYTFKAHSFIDTKSLNTLVPYLDEWEYEYQKLGQPYTVLNKTYPQTVPVAQHDETTPPGPFNPNNYQ